MPVSLLIADDHPLVRQGLRLMFEDSGIEVTADAGTPAEALRLALDPKVEVMLLDIHWINDEGGRTRARNGSRDAGLALLPRIRAARPALPIVMYSSETDERVIERCRRLGANGYLIKGFHDGLLASAVRAVHAGEQIWPRVEAALRSGT